jgi:hypothetical protein
MAGQLKEWTRVPVKVTASYSSYRSQAPNNLGNGDYQCAKERDSEKDFPTQTDFKARCIIGGPHGDEYFPKVEFECKGSNKRFFRSRDSMVKDKT